MGMENDEARKATTKLYGSFWLGSVTATDAIANSLRMLSEGYEKAVIPATYRLYTAVLSGLDQVEIIRAFTRASEECRFWPSPATLREFSGRPVSGDPIAAEAKAELLKLLEGMRGKHGPALKPILGKVLYGREDDPKDANGDRVAECDAPRAESTHFPIARRTEAALVRLGWGDRQAGIAVVADHPAVKRKQPDPSDEQYKTNQLRASDELLKRFTDAYREK
jgi:hypothetical protein